MFIVPTRASDDFRQILSASHLNLFEIYVFWNLKKGHHFIYITKKTTKTQLYEYPAKNVTFMGSKW